MSEIIKGIVLLVGSYYSLMFLYFGFVIFNMSENNYKQLKQASASKEGWKSFWKYYAK